MIIFCEECGARNDLDSDKLSENLHAFKCCQCEESLVISKPLMDSGQRNAFAEAAPQCMDNKSMAPITVLIVDDSTVLRKIIKEMFSGDRQLKVVGEAEHGLKALGAYFRAEA